MAKPGLADVVEDLDARLLELITQAERSDVDFAEVFHSVIPRDFAGALMALSLLRLEERKLVELTTTTEPAPKLLVVPGRGYLVRIRLAPPASAAA